MEREIAFRGKSKSTGEWLDGYYVGDNTIIAYNEVVYDLGFIDTSPCHDCYPGSIGQFTGLYDKNGKEIYEGDILRVEEFKNESDSIEKSEEFYEVFDLEDMKGEKIREYITPVCWEYGAFAISVSQENDTYLDVLFGDMRRSFPIFIFEIIGNIHDNPELLKDGRD